MACADFAPRPASGQVCSISNRFAQIELPIIRDKRLTDTDIRIYSALVAHRNAGHGKAWPKRQTLADIANVHPETVSRCTSRLVECGWLVKAGGIPPCTRSPLPMPGKLSANKPNNLPRPPARPATASPPPRKNPTARLAFPPRLLIEQRFLKKTYPKPLPCPKPSPDRKRRVVNLSLRIPRT
jgi:hypothetical protein